MSALVTTNSPQLPAHLANRIGSPSAISSAMTGGISAGGGSGFKRISIRGGRFRIREGSTETVLPDNVLRAVIVGASPGITKSFYKGTYNPKATEEKKPDCYSTDGIRPASDATDPQSQQCANCPQNAWGSKITDNGGKMKACADQKRLAVISADDQSEDPEVYLFQVTPAALTQFRQYGELLASKGYPAECVVTEISFDTKEAFPKAQFKFGGFIEQGQLATVDKLVDAQIVRDIIGEKDQVASVVEPTPIRPPPVKVKEEYVPPPVVIEDAIYEEVAPPKPTKGFGGTPTAKEPAPAQTVKASQLSSDINDILNSMKEETDE